MRLGVEFRVKYSISKMEMKHARANMFHEMDSTSVSIIDTTIRT